MAGMLVTTSCVLNDDVNKRPKAYGERYA